MIGGVIGLICCCVLVYSEVNAMMLTRDLDALKAAELLSAPKSIELSQRELVRVCLWCVCAWVLVSALCGIM